ncbi:MAG: translocation/assembly module TamB domain-containing protein [Bacteroidia bacterium]
MIGIVSALMFLVLSCCVLIRIPAIQTLLIHKISSYISGELNTNIRIGSVRIELIKKLVLRDIYVEDLKHDTLLFAEKLKVDISEFNRGEEKINFSSVELQKARIKLQRYIKDDGLNFQFIVDYFSTSQSDTTSHPWNIAADNFILDNVVFSLRDHLYNDTTSTVDFDDLFTDSLFAHFSNIKSSGDSVFTTIKNISFKEKSGFALNHFEADAKIAPDEMRFQKLKIQTPSSSINTNLTFSYDSLADFDHFLSRVNFDADFNQSKVASNDIACFTSDLSDFDRNIILTGHFHGTVDQFKGKNIILNYGEHTFFKGNVALTGLPDFEETFIDLVIDKMVTNTRDIETIPVAPFKNQKTVQLTSEVKRLATLEFKGKFTGFYNDFVAYGNFNTALGFISSDINLKFKKTPLYSGHITTHDFDLGKLFSAEKIIGKLSLNADIKGTHFNPDKMTASVKGNIANIELYKYNYHNITLDADIAKKLFNGALAIVEDNLNFSFNGTVDFTHKLPLFDFSAKIKDAKLAKLNLIKRDTTSALSVNTQFHFEGNTIDNMDGFIKLNKLRYSENEKNISTDEIELESVAEGNDRHIHFISEFADLDIRGDYRRTSVIKSFENLLRKYLPGVEEKINTVSEMQDFTFNVKIKKPDPILEIFLPSLKVQDNSSLSGNFNTLINDFRMNLVSEKIEYGGMKWNAVLLNGKTNANKFEITLNVNEFKFRDSLSLKNVNLIAETAKDSALFKLSFQGRDSVNDRLAIGGEINFNDNGKTAIRLQSSDILLERRKWSVANDNMVIIDSTGTLINNLVLYSDNQHMGIAGKISSGENDILKVALQNFETKVMNRVLELFNVSIGGVADGNIHVASVLKVPRISSDLTISNFSYFNDTLGNLSIDVDYNTSEKVINVRATASKGEIKNIVVNGKYYIKSPYDELDFSISLTKTNLQPFGHYISGFASDVRGTATADLILKGLASKPELSGTARIQRGSFLVDYLNTRYSFSDEIQIKKDGFYFKNMAVNDEDGNQAFIDGNIFHTHFNDFGIDLSIKTDKFIALNTSKTQNELFYGKAYASGIVNFSGLFNDLSINGTLTSEKGTHISIPLSNPEEVDESSFITFITPDTLQTKIEAEPVDLSGINMDFDFAVTPEAEIELIFDEKIGDIMRGNGSGTIRMVIDRYGNFNMYGDYTINKGDYLFTLQNVINKKFDVERGGTIKWNGSPYDAIIDLDAKYKLRASLFDLLQDTSSNFKKRTDVVLNMNLKNRLMNPDITFRIDIPNIDPATDNQVKRFINSDQEVNRQTLSLLILNRFAIPPDATPVGSSGGAFEATTSELLSRQLSNWAQQITDEVDIGINYRASDKISSEQLEVALSTKLFNDRVTVDGVVGYTGANESTQTTSSIVGDFNVDVQVSDNGRFHFKAFNRSNNNTFLNNFNSLYTQGIGVFYRQDFNKIGDLFKKKKEVSKEKKPDVSINSAQ